MTNENSERNSGQERILCAAIWIDDGVCHKEKHSPVETGYIICGHRHHNCLYVMPAINGQRSSDFGKVREGFLTSLGRYVNRVEAHMIALDAGQLNWAEPTGEHHNPPELYSEDLY